MFLSVKNPAESQFPLGKKPDPEAVGVGADISVGG